MRSFQGTPGRKAWSLLDTYQFISAFLIEFPFQQGYFPRGCAFSASHRQFCSDCAHIQEQPRRRYGNRRQLGLRSALSYCSPLSRYTSRPPRWYQRRPFHDYFVTHLPSSSLHPDSRSSSGPHHKLPRSASTPHTPGCGPSPAAAPPMIGPSRELTVVRIPLRSAKHHFGVSVSRGTRPYNEDTYQAGTIEMPAFAKRAPVSLSRNSSSLTAKATAEEATSAGGASGDPQVFYFGVFDGHGGHECSDFLKEELHEYIEDAAVQFDLPSSLKMKSKKRDPILASPAVARTESSAYNEKESLERDSPVSALEEKGQPEKRSTVVELETSLVRQWKDTVGGYFRRFKPEFFSIPSMTSVSEPVETCKTLGDKKTTSPNSIEAVLMYAFLRADLDFITAQAAKPDADSTSDLPLNNDEILGEPSRQSHRGRIGGPIRFKGGSTASVAMISTPTPTPFWHPASPSTLIVSHVGDTRIILCETSTGVALPVTTNHHPSSPIESTRLRRYAATFVTDSFGEERMSGLANTRSFGDMRSKRIGVSAEPEVRCYELGPAQYSFLVLISDGVSGTLSDQEVVDVVKEARTPEQGAKDVVSFATEVSREGDNATCLVVRLGGWERRGEGGMGSLGTKEVRDFRRQEATDPRSRRT